MREGNGGIEGDEWEKRTVVCQKCGKAMQNGSLRQHLAGVHDIYNCESVVEENCFNRSAGVEHRAVQGQGKKGKIQCPVPGCPGQLGSPWMLRRHFRDIHPEDTVYIPWEGGPHPRCGRCRMQCNPAYPKHAQTKTCEMGRERREQREKAIDACLSLRQMFYANGDVLGKVDAFWYLGRILAQDDDDIRAVRSQIKKARGTWARVSQILRAENAPPKISAKFYKAVVQSILLYGS